MDTDMNTDTATGTAAALRTALAYHRAWTSGDLDGALALVGDDVVWRAPDGEIAGKAGYRDYLAGFMEIMTGLTDGAAYGDDERALLLYFPHTAVTDTAPAAELFTVRGGEIVENVLVFDRLSYAPAPEDQA